MTQEEHDRWEQAWEESAKRDFERWIYAQCDAEDLAAVNASKHPIAPELPRQTPNGQWLESDEDAKEKK